MICNDPVNGLRQKSLRNRFTANVCADAIEAHMLESDETDITLMIYEQIRVLKRVAEKLNLSAADVEDIMFGNAKKLIESVKK